MCIKFNEGSVSKEEFQSSRKEKLGGNLWSRRSEVLGETKAPETGSTRSYCWPCMGSVGEDVDTDLLSTLKILFTLYPLFRFLGWAPWLRHGCVLLDLYGFQTCWWRPAGLEHVGNEPIMFYIYLHRNIPLNWNQHRISVLFISSKSFLLLLYVNFRVPSHVIGRNLVSSQNIQVILKKPPRMLGYQC